MKYTFVGVDDWLRKLFEDENGVEFVDVDGQLHTINRYEDWAEPCAPIGVPTPEIETK